MFVLQKVLQMLKMSGAILVQVQHFVVIILMAEIYAEGDVSLSARVCQLQESNYLSACCSLRVIKELQAFQVKIKHCDHFSRMLMAKHGQALQVSHC